MEKKTRGQRNNNPLNIKISNQNWLGKVPAERNIDGTFEQFDALCYGIRAGLKLIFNYIDRYKCDTIRRIIKRWAPPSENNTASYILYVTRVTGIHCDYEISTSHTDKIFKILSAMCFYESAMKIDTPYIKDVYERFFLNQNTNTNINNDKI